MSFLVISFRLQTLPFAFILLRICIRELCLSILFKLYCFHQSLCFRTFVKVLPSIFSYKRALLSLPSSECLYHFVCFISLSISLCLLSLSFYLSFSCKILQEKWSEENIFLEMIFPIFFILVQQTLLYIHSLEPHLHLRFGLPISHSHAFPFLVTSNWKYSDQRKGHLFKWLFIVRLLWTINGFKPGFLLAMSLVIWTPPNP